MTLSDYVKLGALPKNLQEVPLAGVGVVAFSELLKLPENSRSPNGKIVVLPGTQWIATVKGRTVHKAEAVYSCDRTGTIGCWKKGSGEFLLMRVQDDTLVTQKTFKFKEDEVMAGINTELQDMDMFNEDLDAIKNSGIPGDGGAEEVPVDPGKGTSGSTPSDRELAKREREADLAAIRSILANANIVDNTDAQIANHEKGRFMFFITATNPVVRVSKGSELLLDSNGKRQYDPNTTHTLTPEKLQEYAKNNKEIPKASCLQEAIYTIKEAGPGAIKGMVIKTPAATEVGFSNQVSNADDMRIRIMSKEEGLTYLTASYGNYIDEDSGIMGARAARLFIVNSVPRRKKPKADGKSNAMAAATGDTTRKLSVRLTVDKNSRKKTVTRDNFFPMKTYSTAVVQGAKKNIQAALNYNFAKICNGKNDSSKPFSAKAQGQVTRLENGEVTSVWVNNGEPVSIKKFDAISDTDFISTFELPIMKKEQKKDGTGYKYSYVYHELGASDGSGPENQAEYKKLIDATGLSVEDFIKNVNRAATVSSGAGTTVSAVKSAELLAATTQAGITVQGMASLQEVIASLRDAEVNLR